MNAKRCKRIRRVLSGLPVAQLEISYSGGVPLTFRYPKDSYQRVYKDIKRFN
jgi:hypothetical protein